MKANWFSFVLMLSFTSDASAQRADFVHVSGIVVDSVSGLPIPDVHISCGQKGTVSAGDGTFEIEISEGAKLYFTHINYYMLTMARSGPGDRTYLTVRLVERIRLLREIFVNDLPSEDELKNQILNSTPPVDIHREDADKNSAAINHYGKIAPRPVPTLSEQYFQSLQGPKDVTILSSDPNTGLLSLFRAKKPVRHGPAVKSNYRSDPNRITPFKVKMNEPDTLKKEDTMITKE